MIYKFGQRTLFMNTQRKFVIKLQCRKTFKKPINIKQSNFSIQFQIIFGKIISFFGNNYSQSAAKFILILLDALNEELIQKDNRQKQISELYQIDQDDVDQTKHQLLNSDSNDESNEEENSETKQQQQQLIQFNKILKQNQINNDNYEQALEQILQLNRLIIRKKFLGITNSGIECPKCVKNILL